MTDRVNGGYLNAQFLTGSLRHFVISVTTQADGFVDAIAPNGGVTVDGRDYAEGQPIPGSAAEEVYKILAQRSTPVIMYIDDENGDLHVALENTSAGWLDVYTPAVGGNSDGVPANKSVATNSAEVLLDELEGLGATAGFDDIDFTAGVTVTELPYVLNAASADALGSHSN